MMFFRYKDAGFSNTRLKLKYKPVSILITNVCNRTCGGCNQYCGHIPKEKLWNISVDQLRSNIKHCIKFRVPFEIFGGEPTIHPQWRQIKEMLHEFEPRNITVFTNCVTNEKDYRNIRFKRDSMPAKYSRTFIATHIAAVDVMPQGTDFWKLAQQHCGHWQGCFSIIYNNKAYFCEVAGAMDWILNNGENGWDLDETKHPMDHTEEQIAMQANIFCRRCGQCIPPDQRITQVVKAPSLVSISNLDLITKGNMQLVELKLPKKE